MDWTSLIPIGTGGIGGIIGYWINSTMAHFTVVRLMLLSDVSVDIIGNKDLLLLDSSGTRF
jgi:hypothetical protein